MNAIVCTIKPYIQPFEKELALAELAQLANAEPEPIANTSCGQRFIVHTTVSAQQLAGRLSYWERVSHDHEMLTRQVLREATVNRRNGSIAKIQMRLPFDGSVPLPNRRCLRYGPHGIHEYRGKFFPQLVRALVNCAGLKKGAIVADTMCGSGTTLVEAALSSCTALGLDMNPLSILMSRTKCELLRENHQSLNNAYERIRVRLQNLNARSGQFEWLHSLPPSDQQYLRKWFSEKVLTDLEHIAAAIQRIEDSTERNFFWLALSNILRRVSCQKDDDLRIRRDTRTTLGLDVITLYLDEVSRSLCSVVAFLFECYDEQVGRTVVLEGDARVADVALHDWRRKVDAVITSPPYATALPYLDTDRLSLLYLGLLSRPEHRHRESLMIGNREISDKTRRVYWDSFLGAKQTLPSSIVRLIERVHRLNIDSDAGFRRKNLPPLLAKYFVDMKQVFMSLRSLLKEGRPAYVVVGNNHTYAGGRRVEIETATLLAELAETCGFRVDRAIPMEMLVSRDIFRKNAVPSETILFLNKGPD